MVPATLRCSVGSRLFIFTTNGLYALTVQGEPASWIFKVLDNKSMGSHRQCALKKITLYTSLTWVVYT